MLFLRWLIYGQDTLYILGGCIKILDHGKKALWLYRTTKKKAAFNSFKIFIIHNSFWVMSMALKAMWFSSLIKHQVRTG